MVYVHEMELHVPVSDAKAQLTDLVRRAEGGEEVVLTRHGRSVARIVPSEGRAQRLLRRMEAIERAVASARKNRLPGPSAARSADFLYGEDGLPG